MNALGMAVVKVIAGISETIPQNMFRQVFCAGLFGETARTVNLLEEILREVARIPPD